MTAGGYPSSRPQPGRGRGRGKGGGGGYGAAAVNQQLHKSFADFKAATDILKTSSTALTVTASEMTKASKDNQSSINDLVNTIGQLVSPGQYGGMMGGTMMPGFRMSGVAGPASGRPGASWGAHGYPGGAGYGMGSAGHGAVSAHGGGLAGLRNIAAQAIHQSYGTAGYRYEQDSVTGDHIAVDQSGTVVARAGTRDALNNQIQNSGRGIVSSATGIPHGMGGALRGARSAFGGMASRSGAIGAIGAAGETALRFAGPVGMAVGAAWEGANFIADQRSQNANYQSIYNQSNMAGMGQRVLQGGYGIGQLFSGGLGWGDSGKAFKAVSGMGYQGGARQERLDFVSSNYKSMGMSVDESMKLIAIASSTLTTSLSDLHTELQNVSKAAQTTGQSAQVMRAAFMTNLQSTTGQGLGTAAGPAAQVQAQMVGPSLGRAYAGTSMTGMTDSLTQQAITGSFVGQNNPGQFAANQQNNPMLRATAIDNRMKWMLGGLIPPDTRSYIEKKITEAGGPAELEGTNGDNISLNIANDPMVTKMNPFQVDAVLTVNGITHNANDTRQMYGLLVHMVGQQMKGSTTSAKAKAAAAAKTNRGLTGAAAERAYEKAGGAPSAGSVAATPHGGIPAAAGQSVGALDPGVRNATPGKAPFIFGRSTHGGTLRWDPVVNKLAKAIGHDGKVIVTTKDGQQMVSLKEAQSKYLDQLVDGTATIASGKHAGSTVADTVGVEDAASIKSAGQSEGVSDKGHYALGGKYGKKIMEMGLNYKDLEKVAKRFKDKGDKGLDEYAKGLKADEVKDAKKGGKGSGSIKLYMTPALAKWIGADTTGDVTTAAANDSAPPAQSSTGASAPIPSNGFVSPFN